MTWARTPSSTVSIVLWMMLACLSVVWSYYQQRYGIGMIGDHSWLLHMAERVLDAGHYVDDFFDANLPGSIALYMPIIMLSRSLAWGWLGSLLAFFYPLILLLIGYACAVIRRCFPDEPILTSGLCVSLLFFAFVASPWVFAERDYLVFFLQAPYVFSMITALHERALPRPYRTANALLCALAVALKPFYILIPFVFELRDVYQTKKFTRYSDCALMLSVLLLYLAVIVFYFPDYIDFAKHVASPYYYLALHNSLRELMNTPWMHFYILMMGAYAALSWTCEKKVWLSVLAIAASIGFAANLAQHFLALYHEYPCFAYSTLILMVLLYEYMVIKQLKTKIDLAVFIVLLIIAFWYPLRTTVIQSHVAAYQTQMFNALEHYEREFAHQKAYIISAYLSRSFPLLDVSTAKSQTRFAHHWPLLALARQFDAPLTARRQHDQAMITQWVVEDLKRAQPDVILIENFVDKHHPEQNIATFETVLKTNPDFVDFWKAYQYSGTTDALQTYKRKEVHHV